MIPLSRWLNDREGTEPQPLPLLNEAIDVLAGDAVPLIAPVELEAADVAAREQEFADALRRAEDTLATERHFHAQREQALREELGATLVCALTAQIEAGLAGLQEELEAALTDILRPFLGLRSTAEAISALAMLIETDFRNQAEPLLEVRAPRSLHDLVRPALEQAGLSTSLSEASRIEMVFKSRTSQFEQLATRWLDIIAERNG